MYKKRKIARFPQAACCHRVSWFAGRTNALRAPLSHPLQRIRSRKMTYSGTSGRGQATSGKVHKKMRCAECRPVDHFS
jgi:hypothetical protein